MMLTQEQIGKFNWQLMEKLGAFLNLAPNSIAAGAVDALVNERETTREFAFSVVLAERIGLDIVSSIEDKALFDHYFPQMVHHLAEAEYQRDPYYDGIKVPEVKAGRWELKQQSYQPYEVFVCNDLQEMSDGRVIPQLGFFEHEFPYPALLEDGREWMLITPNEIETMKSAAERSSGNVLTYGLGLGYYAYLVSEKDDVSAITIVEKDPDVIQLFETLLLPQFRHADKIKLVEDDAFAHAKQRMAAGNFNSVFTDLWNGPADGVELYLRMKEHEKLSPQSTFLYWIEKTISYYI
jgi:hypothetical protein